MVRVDIPLFATLRFECAVTGKLVDYEVPGNAGTLKELWSRTLLRSCQHCGQVHRFAFRSAYVAGMLASRAPHSLVGDGAVARPGADQA